MTHAEHYARACEVLEMVDKALNNHDGSFDGSRVNRMLAYAQVHATLAVAVKDNGVVPVGC